MSKARYGGTTLSAGALLFVMCIAAYGNPTCPGWGKTVWGMSPMQVKQMYAARAVSGQRLLLSDVDVSGHRCNALFLFTNNSLFRIEISRYNPGGLVLESDYAVYSSLAAKLTAKYGKPSSAAGQDLVWYVQPTKITLANRADWQGTQTFLLIYQAVSSENL